MFESLIANIIVEFAKGIFLAIPRAIKNYKFVRFFGKESIKSDRVFLVLDPYEHPTSRANLRPGMHRFIKDFKGRKPNANLIGEDKVLGSCSIRVTKYATSIFGIHREKTNPIKTVLDENILNDWECSLICSGSSDSNIKTYDIENLPENNLYSFGFGSNGYCEFDITGEKYSINQDGDAGIIVRINNPHHPEHKLFICAGIGEWGTSGASYFLFKNWKKLYKRYGKNRNFVIVLRVPIGQDESAREIRAFNT